MKTKYLYYLHSHAAVEEKPRCHDVLNGGTELLAWVDITVIASCCHIEVAHLNNSTKTTIINIIIQCLQ